MELKELKQVLNIFGKTVIANSKKKLDGNSSLAKSLKYELKDSNLYISNNNRFEEVTEKLSTLEKELENKENRWLELLEMEEAINKENEQ